MNRILCQLGIMSSRHEQRYHQDMERKPFPSETQDRFIVRFPDGMRDRIAEVAKANNRSMNAEIVARLERSFTADKEVEQIAFESGFEASMLREEVARLRKLLENQKADEKKMIQEQSKAIAAEVLKHLHAEADAKIEEARQAVAELKAAGKWPLSNS